MDHLRNLLSPSRLTAIVDIGANPIDSHPPYARMLDEGLCTVIGFDPQQSAEPVKGVTYVPKVIGTGEPGILKVCSAPGMTSLLEPNTETVAAFPGFADWATVIERREVDTTRLDDVHEIKHMDLLCMDIQGSEIDVMRCAPARLREAVAVITEVSFVPLYRGQPTFGDIDGFMRRAGYIPHCFAAAKVWPIETKIQPPRSDPHQMLEADVAYVRNFIEDRMSPEQWRHLALIAHHVLGSFDLAMRCVEALADSEQISPEALMRYRQMLEAM